jgi:hypothetical protein
MNKNSKRKLTRLISYLHRSSCVSISRAFAACNRASSLLTCALRANNSAAS